MTPPKLLVEARARFRAALEALLAADAPAPDRAAWAGALAALGESEPCEGWPPPASQLERALLLAGAALLARPEGSPGWRRSVERALGPARAAAFVELVAELAAELVRSLARDDDPRAARLPALRESLERTAGGSAPRFHEARFQALFESTLPAVLWCADGRLTAVNEAFVLLLGRSREELLASGWRGLAPEEHRAAEEAALRETLARGRCSPYESELLDARGERVPVLVSAALLPGSSEQGVAYALDLRGRKAVERRAASLADELAERAEELQRLLDLLPVGVFIAHDSRCETMTANAAGERMLGLPPGSNPSKSGPDAATLPYRVLRDGVELASDELPMQVAARTGRAISGVEIDIEHEDGARVRLYTFATPLLDASGEVRGVLGAFVDITQRRTAEEERERSQAQLRLITDAVPALVSYVDADLRYQLLNRTYQGWFGLDLEWARGRHVREVLGAAAWPEVRPHMERALAGELVTYEQELPYRGSGPRWVRVNYVPDRDPAGAVRGFAVLVTDIGDAKRAEAALREREAEFRGIFELSAVGAAQIEASSARFLLVNRRLCEITGFTEDELLQRSLTQLTHPADREREREVVGPVLRGDADRWELEKRLVVAGGREVWVMVAGRLLRDERGRPARTLLHVLDITYRKRIEEALRASESSYRMLFDGSPSPIWEEDFSAVATRFEELRRLGVRDLREHLAGHPEELPELAARVQVLRVNAASPPFFEVQSKVELPERLAAYLGPQGLEVFRDELAALYAGAQRYSAELPIVMPRGGERIVSMHLAVAPGSEQSLARVLVSFVDVTRQKQLESERAQLLESERAARTEAERASRLKDEFLSTLSHELRTPLNAILGWSHLMRGQPGDAALVAQGVEVIERNVRAQARLVDDLLDVGRIGAGKLRLDLAPLELGEVVASAVEAVRPGAESQGLRLSQELAEGLRMHGDARRLEQVASNLLTNAIKFTPRGGEVRVRLAREGDEAVLEVSDTGEGIAPGFVPHLFERFRQADASATRRHGGLGIGLALVRQLVELHGGAVSARSEGPGRGATFTVRLRLEGARRASNGARRAATGTPELAGARVLVVDDQPESAEVARRVLQDAGALVRTAGSGTEALELTAKERFDVLLSDIGMPGLDGYAMLEEARRRGFTAPAVALTALSRPEDRERAARAGYQRLLAKPVDPRRLLELVAELQQAQV